jgi:UDP-N-acetylglucosamine enolpyruvyl transferase
MFLGRRIHPCEGGAPEAQEVFLDVPTVTGTENIMMAAVGAEGRRF